ncbi:hypothetical protein ACFQ1S_06610, partial [Kibdelosporangium lantanae]
MELGGVERGRVLLDRVLAGVAADENPLTHTNQLPERAREVVEYRKSGLSLNHIQGCPLDCAYCVRHTYGL